MIEIVVFCCNCYAHSIIYLNVRRSEEQILFVLGDEIVRSFMSCCHMGIWGARLARIAADEGCALIVVANKWDLVDHELATIEEYKEQLQAQLRDICWAFVACLIGHECCVLLLII